MMHVNIEATVRMVDLGFGDLLKFRVHIDDHIEDLFKYEFSIMVSRLKEQEVSDICKNIFEYLSGHKYKYLIMASLITMLKKTKEELK